MPQGVSLLDALKEQGIVLESPCNGKGICGKCRVLVHNSIPHTPEEKKHLSAEEICKGVHLSCMVQVYDNLEISLNVTHKSAAIITEANVIDTEVKPLVQKKFVSLPNPSISDQRADDERLLASVKKIESGNLNQCFNHFPLSFLKKLPSVLRQKHFNVTLIQILDNITGVESGDTVLKNYGVAIDIGTTTLAAYLYDLNTGKQISVSSQLNPQKKYGADVISRIEYSSKNPTNQSEMSILIQSALNDLIQQLVSIARIQHTDIYAVTLSGNTTMLHLLLELPSTNIACAPFIPVTLSGLVLKPNDLNLNINPSGRLFILPSVSAYIGSDTTAAVLSTGMHNKIDISLLIDIGTNGEIVIGNNSFLYACSTAAGPAFEGANISCGIGSVDGAVSGVSVMNNGTLKIDTIRGYKPVGICGSGLIDAVSCMLKIGVLDETGRILDKDEIKSNVHKYSDRVYKINNQQAFLLVPADETFHHENIYISQKDIREIQNAKAAIAAGINILIHEAGCKAHDIKCAYLSGGFGSFINIDSALSIGLLPKELSEKTKPVGNAAGAGTIHALLSEDKLSQIEKIAKQIKYLELSSRKDFTYEYTENMFFWN